MARPLSVPAARPEVLAFLQEVREDPADDAPRLVLADWLQDRGDPRGEFVHLRVVGARLAENDPRREALARRERQLLGRHLFDWLGPLIDHVKGGGWEFERGLVQLEARAEKFLTSAVASLAATETGAWVDGLRLEEMTPRLVARLARFPLLGVLTTLDLSDNGLRGSALETLTRSRLLAHVAVLRLAGNRVGPQGARALAECPHLGRLTTLDLTGNRIGDAGAEALAGSPHLARLRALCVGDNGIGPEALDLLRRRFGDGVRAVGGGRTPG
jgi:uncharacterized protein (TIGR02996 family)